MKKEEIELAVCKKFVELYNVKFKKDLVSPFLCDGQPPDCITYSRNNKKEILKLEITVTSPKEAKNFGKSNQHESITDFTNFNPQITQIYEDITKGKGKKYDKQTKSSLILLLQASNIEYDDKDISRIIKIISDSNSWKGKFRQLGFKQIWYVSTKNIYNIYSE